MMGVEGKEARRSELWKMGVGLCTGYGDQHEFEVRTTKLSKLIVDDKQI